jgi:hypothetical protein
MEKYFFLKIAIYYIINIYKYNISLRKIIIIKKKKIFFLFLLLTI